MLKKQNEFNFGGKTMKDIKVTDSVKYIGVDDHDIDLFESQYVVPNGVSYNSYVILDEKVAVMDTVDARKTDEWLVNLEEALDGRNVDYIVVSHMEPDHAASLQVLAEKYPEAKVVGNAKTFNMIPQFFTFDLEGRKSRSKRRRYIISWISYITVRYGTNGSLARSYGSI